jgi:hypothetical protein
MASMTLLLLVHLALAYTLSGEAEVRRLHPVGGYQVEQVR